jgi:hypothetical protein
MNTVRNSLNQKYDDSTAVVIAESGYIKGDPFPDIRGLLHIKNDIEQKIFSDLDTRRNLLVIFWSNQYKEIESFLDKID